jgi:hypothetical protein
MPSHYDEKKKCRVGTMDEDQFYAECGAESAAWFRGLIHRWTEAGGALKWGAGGVSLRGTIDSKEAAVCFLAPQFAGKQDRIELACTTLTKQIGQKRSKILEDAIRSAADDLALGKTMISVVQPGTLPAGKQKALAQAFLELLV